MKSIDPWKRAVLLRAVPLGAALGVAGSGGAAVMRSHVTSAPAGAVLLTTFLAALATGIWAGSVADPAHPRLRERWLPAGAITAAAGAYASFSALYQQFYPGPYWALANLLVTVALPAYVIGLVLPAFLTWRALGEEEADEPGTIARAATSTVMTITAAAAIGLLLSAVVALPYITAGTVLMLAAALLLAPLSFVDPAEAAPAELTIAESVSPLGSIQVTEVNYGAGRQPERKLYLNGEEESGELVRSGAPTLAYIAAAESFFAATTPPASSYLFLGGGAYTLPRRMAERDARARITVVELDPEVTRVAYRYFGVAAHHRIGSVHGDARAYLEASAEPHFDRIYVDVYGGQESLPYSIVTREAAETMRGRLNPGGVLAVNLIGRTAGEEARQPWSVVRTFAQVFPRMAVYSHFGADFPDRQNLLMVATVDSPGEFPLSAGTFDLWPLTEWPAPDDLMTLRDIYTAEEDNQLAQRAYGGGRPRTDPRAT